MVRLILCGALGLCLASTSLAQTALPPSAASVDPLHQAGRNVTISLLTMGNGEEVWEKFGHNGIWIHDNVTGRDTVFNWGVFSFQQPHFIAYFLQGRMLYSMGGDSLSRILWVYRYLNRSVTSQELDLTAAQRDSILGQIQWYARPENVNYRYDYFGDNCSTRVRDIVDRAVGGQLRAGASAVTQTSYRWHTLRLVQGDKPLTLGIDIGLGEPSDRPLTRWQEMFLPRKLHDFVATLQVRDSSGAAHPLVRSDRVLFHGTRPDEPSAPPNFGPWLLGVGLVVAGLFVWLGSRAAAGGRGVRLGAAILFGVWSLVAGLLGVILTLLWAVTDHAFAHANENLLLLNPLWLVMAVCAALSLWRGCSGRLARRLAVGLAALGVLALLAHVVTLSRQNNLAIIDLALPPALAIAWVVCRPLRRTPLRPD